MSVRIALFAALTAVGALNVPMAAAAEAPSSAASDDVASHAANMAVLDRFYRAIEANDGAAIAGLLEGATVWIHGEGAPFAEARPSDAPGALFEGVFGRVDPQAEVLAATPDGYLPSGDSVVALGRFSATNRSTGEALVIRFAHVFTFSAGRITQFQPYTDASQRVGVGAPD